MRRRVALLTVMATLALIGATNVPAGAGPGSSEAGTMAGPADRAGPVLTAGWARGELNPHVLADTGT